MGLAGSGDGTLNLEDLFSLDTSGNNDAVHNGDRTRRYALHRRWAPGPRVLWVLLNPSTADEKHNDPTIKKCISYSQKWGFGGLVMVNIFSLKATDPKDLKASSDPGDGEESNSYLLRYAEEIASEGGVILCGMGAHASHRGRGRAVVDMLNRYPLHYLVLTDSGIPGHPLYLPGNLTPQLWQSPHIPVKVSKWSEIKHHE